MTTYGLHEAGHNAPSDFEWFDDAKSMFKAWETKPYIYGWTMLAIAQGERVCEMLRNPMGYFPIGFLVDGVDLMAKYSVGSEIHYALSQLRAEAAL